MNSSFRKAAWLLFLFPFLTLVGTAGHAQGLIDGYMKGKGHLDAALTYSTEKYDQYFVADSLVSNPNLGTIRTQSVSLFATAGLTDWLDVVLTLPYIKAEPGKTSFWASQQNVQDLTLALKARVLKTTFGKVELTGIVSAAYSAPLSKYVIDSPIAIGHGSKNIDGRATLQAKAGSFFAMAQYGYTRKDKVMLNRGFEVNVPDVTDFVSRIGVAHAKFYLDAFVQIQKPYKNFGTDIGNGFAFPIEPGIPAQNSAGVPFPSNRVGFTRVGLNGYVPVPVLKGVGITAGFATILSGTNIGKSTRFSAGLVYGLSNLW